MKMRFTEQQIVAILKGGSRGSGHRDLPQAQYLGCYDLHLAQGGSIPDTWVTDYAAPCVRIVVALMRILRCEIAVSSCITAIALRLSRVVNILLTTQPSTHRCPTANRPASA